MTGRDGVHRRVSLPPGAARDQPVAVMRRAAAGELAPPIAEVVAGWPNPSCRSSTTSRCPGWLRPGLPDRRRGVRGPPARGRGHGQGRRRRLGARRCAHRGRRGHSGRAGPVGTRPARPRPGAARPVPGDRDGAQVGGTFRPGDQRLIFGLYEPATGGRGGHIRRAGIRHASDGTRQGTMGPMDVSDRLAGRFDASRPRLRAMAYRMLGSLADADDAVQEGWMTRRAREAARDDVGEPGGGGSPPSWPGCAWTCCAPASPGGRSRWIR